MNYNIIIPTTARNKSILELSLPYIEKNLEPKRIVVISKNDLKLSTDIEYDFIDEDKLFPGLSYNNMKEIIEKRDKFAGKRAGWYLQQFLKMFYAYVCEEDYYISWDADTIPLHRINMMEENHPFFDIKDEYNQPYFTTINKIFDNKIKRNDNFSFISEHMIFDKRYMIEMLNMIYNNEKLEGNHVFEKIMNAVNDIDLLLSGFSEFETYGNYMRTMHPEIYKIRKLRALRNGDRVYGNKPTKDNLVEAGKEYDIITFENRIVV